MKTIKLPTGLKVNHVLKNGTIQIQVPEQATAFQFRSTEVEKHYQEIKVMGCIRYVPASLSSINYFGLN